MPAKPAWLLKLPQIIETLHTLDSPVVDRAVIEKLFRVSRVRAIQLMHRFEGYQVGKTFIIDRTLLIDTLETLAAGGALEGEQKRQKRLVEALQKDGDPYAPTREVKFKAQARPAREITSLGDGMTLEAGVLRVEFREPEELLARLYDLIRTIGEDFEGFQKAAKSVSAGHSRLTPPVSGVFAFRSKNPL